MKKILVAACSILVIVFVLEKSGVLDALLIFLLTGAIPGTKSSLSAGTMFAICTLTAALFIINVTAFTLTRELSLRKLTRKHIAYKKRMPKRRFLGVGR